MRDLSLREMFECLAVTNGCKRGGRRNVLALLRASPRASLGPPSGFPFPAGLLPLSWALLSPSGASLWASRALLPPLPLPPGLPRVGPRVSSLGPLALAWLAARPCVSARAWVPPLGWVSRLPFPLGGTYLSKNSRLTGSGQCPLEGLERGMRALGQGSSAASSAQ